MPASSVCPNCGTDVKPAMVKCFECGQRLAVRTPVRTGRKAAGVAHAEAPVSIQTPQSRPHAVPSEPCTAALSHVARGASRVAGVRPHRSAVESDRTAHRRPAAGESAQPVRRPAEVPATDPGSGTREDQPSRESGHGVLFERCSCGSRMRVPSSWRGRKKKCRRCGAALLLGSGVISETSESLASLNQDREALVDRLIHELAAEIKQHPERSSLTRRVSGRQLSKLQQRLKVQDPLSRDEAMRRRATVMDLGRTRDVRAIGILAQAQHDAWEAVRQSVATALGELADPACLPLALGLLADSDADVVRDAIAALRAIADPRTVPILLLFGQRDSALHLQVLEAVVGMGKPVVPKLIEVVQGHDNALFRDAVIALGRIRDGRAVESLLSALDRSSGPARLLVIEALGRIGDPRAVGPLIGLLEDAAEPVQIAATTALIQMPDTRAVRPLISMLRQTGNFDLQKCAMRALAATRDPRGVPAIARLIDQADVSLWECIAESLGTIGDRAACYPLVRLLGSDNHRVLLKAIGALRKVATDDAIEALIPLVQHSNPSIRRQTVEVLGDLNAPDAFDLFAEMLSEDASFEVRAAAAKGLGKLKDRHAISLLEQALRDEPTVRCAAVMGLTSIGEKQVIPALLASLKDPTPAVRYHAVVGLGKLKAEQAAGAIRRLLEDKDSMVQTGAKKALNALGIERPHVSPRRRVMIAFGRLIPDSLAGKLPGGAVTFLVFPLVLAAAAGWMAFDAAAGPSNLEIAQIMRATAESVDAVWAPGSEHVALMRDDGTVDIWKPDTGGFVSRMQFDKPVQFAESAGGSPSAIAVWTKGKPCQIGIWKCSDGLAKSPTPEWRSVEVLIRSAVAAPDGGTVLAVTGPQTAAILNTVTGETVAELPLSNRPAPALSPDGLFAAGIVVRGPDPRNPHIKVATLTIYSAETGEILAETDAKPFGRLSRILFDSTGTTLLALGTDWLRRVTWNVDGPAAVTNVEKIPKLSNLLAAPEGGFVGIHGSTLEVFDAMLDPSDPIRASVMDGRNPVQWEKARISPDGRYLLLLGEESKSAWVVDVPPAAAEHPRELTPLNIPPSARNAS